MSKGKPPTNLIIVVVVGACILLFCVEYLLPPARRGDKSREAETKANLHNIQLHIERFAVDTGGSYPQYLIGGEPKWAETVTDTASANSFQNISDCDPSLVSDPLIRRGYLDAYPRNPFSRDGSEIHRIQVEVANSALDGDPLRNAHELGALLGTRFGPYCTSMGQVLCDVRFPTWVFEDKATGEYVEQFSGSAVEYRMWDQFAKKTPTGTYMPGMFFYKGVGPIMMVGGSTAENKAILPTEIDQYMLAAYGGPKTKGKDMLGPSAPPIQYMIRGSDSLADDAAAIGNQSIFVWPQTHSELAADGKLGDPFHAANSSAGNEQLQYSNPNDIPDGIILVLTAGEDHWSSGPR